jgi:hypothetical protein
MIRLVYGSSLGERLSNYAFARALAHSFGLYLEALPLPDFPGTATPVEGVKLLSRPTLWTGNWPFDAQSGRRISLEEIRFGPGSALTLRGSFLRWDLIKEHQDDIRGNWLRLQNQPPARHAGDFLVCLQRESLPQRRDETDKQRIVLEEEACLKAEEIRRIVALVKPKRLFFFSENPRHQLVDLLQDLSAEIVFGTGLELFRLIQSFPKVAICQSELAWWAAFLGHAEEIYFPRIEIGPWSHPEPANLADEPWWHGIDLRATNSRFIYNWH